MILTGYWVCEYTTDFFLLILTILKIPETCKV